MKKLLLILALVALSYADIQSDSLALHNNERNAYGVPSVTWSASLAATAQAYAQTMASTGTTSHSTNRVNVGENLAWGSGSSVTVTSLGNLWLKEKQYFIPGQDFPDVSTTGSWSDVAHYTQLMWELTTEIGCGIAQASSGRYNLVCHYSPQGNINGKPVYTVGSSSSSSSSSPSTSSSTSSSSPSSSSSSSSPSSSSSTSTGSTSTQPTTNTTTTTGTSASQPSSSSSTSTSTSASTSTSSSQFITDSLTAHNTERNNYGVPSLVWNTTLASTAQAYAQVMASTGTTSHSTNRVNVGENLAWGSGSSINTIFLIGLWLAEKKYYVPGTDFPYVSTTSSWSDVAHYTQMMWEQTTDVGCGIAQASSGRYNLVCHYYVQGNIDGEPVYTVGAAPITSSSTGSTSTQPATNTTSTTTPANSTTTAPANTTTTTPQTNTTASTGSSTSTSTSTSQPSSSSSSPSTSAPSASSSQFITDALNAHNNERKAHGVPSLTWSTTLAKTAQAYAQTMASTGTTSHSTGRVNVGENLAWGSGKSVTTTSLVGLWLAEKKYYIPGKTFPNVSTTGSWSSVAHYTQLMWRKTTQVGCGVAKSSSGRYNLVCHYSPQGNINGQSVY